MYRGYKIIPFIPAGRKKTMEILFNYFLKNADIIDEVMLWQNTKDEKDIDFIKRTASANPLFKVYTLPRPYKFQDRVQLNTGHFFEYCTDPKAIYIRFDDDIIFLEDDFITKIVDFRIDNPKYLAVFANIVNNALCAFEQQQAGTFDSSLFEIEDDYCMNLQTWGNPEFAIFIHELLLDAIDTNTIDKFYFPNRILKRERFSISCFAILGSTYAEFGGKLDMVDNDEEIWLTELYPAKHKLENIVLGDALVSHYTFSPYQKKYVVETDIIDRYKKVSRQKLSKDYYKLL